MSMLEAAQAWHAAGCSVYPPADDGSKRPAGKWQDFQHRRMTEQELQSFWNVRRDGVGIICGKVSGNLEMLELEGRATNSLAIDAIVFECQARGIDWLWDMFTLSGYSEWTPSGGLHILYRIHDHDVPGNTKVARRPATAEELAANPDDKLKVMAETRGEGGFVIVAPSGGRVHPTGDSWSVQAGQIGQIPMISWAERCLLHEAVHAALDETPKPAPIAPQRPQLTRSLDQTRPGDDFQLRASWDEILTPHGWLAVTMQAGTTYWMRPGKKFSGKNSHSATTGHAGVGAADRLYVFSSSTVFNPETPYNKFHAYAVLNHGGDFSSAAKELARLGYGTPASSHDDARMVLDSVKATQAPVVLEQAGSVSDKAAHTETVLPEKLLPETLGHWDESYPRPKLRHEDFLDESFTVRGAGNLYAKAYEDAFRYCGFQKAWHFWDGKVWRRDSADRFEDASKHLLDIGDVAVREAEACEAPYARKMRQYVEKLSNMPSPNIPRWARSDKRIAVDAEDFDAVDKLITLKNGIYDLESHTLMPHDPKMLLTKAMPVTFDKDSEAPKWLSFLEDVLPDVEVRNYLQRAVGHALLGKAEQRALFLLHGKSGCGKSQFIRVIEQLFGDFAETATPATFNGQSKTASITNDLNDLKGKRFVSVSELDEGEQLNESLVKRLTGGDTAKSRALWQENTKWRVKFGLFMATNNLPRLSSDDDAIWRRVKPVHFPTIVKEHREEILGLAEKIFAEEASGVLNWVLDGVREYQEKGLDDLPQIANAAENYRKEVDVVEQFLAQSIDDNVIRVDEEQEIQSTQLHSMYVEWCRSNGIKGILAIRRFSQRVERAGYAKRRSNTARFFVGIGQGSRGMLGTIFPMHT